MTEALVIIDIQNDYFPGGNMEVVNSAGAAKKSRNLLVQWRKQKKTIIHIQHISTREGATFFLPETPGVEIHESVSPENGEKVVNKNFPNSFRNTDLEEYLRNNDVSQIIFCGMMSHMCIDATVRAAFDKGFTCIVAEDACATRDLSYEGIDVNSSQVHASFMAALSAVYAKVTTSEQIINNQA